MGIVRIIAQSLAKIVVHTIFSKKDRRPFLRDPKLREELHRYVGGILVIEGHHLQGLLELRRHAR